MSMAVVLIIPTSMKRERFPEVKGTPTLGFPFIVAVKRTTSATIGEAETISSKGAKFHLLGCQQVLSKAKLISQLMMNDLSHVQRIAQSSDLGPLIETVGWSYSTRMSVSWLLLHIRIRNPKTVCRSLSTFFQPLLADSKPWRMWRMLGVFWRNARGGIFEWRKEERDNGITQGQLAPRCSGRSDALAVGWIFMPI